MLWALPSARFSVRFSLKTPCFSVFKFWITRFLWWKYKTISNDNLFLMFMSFVMLVPVNMLNVTRVTLSHNRIACKYNCLSQIFENLIKSNFCRREQEVLFRFIYAWLCCGTYGIISKFGYQFGINEVYLIWKHPRISWWCHSKCQQSFF